MQSFDFLVFFGIFCSVHALITDIPSFVHICSRNDPKMEQCIIDSVTFLQPRLKTGIPELNIRPLDPLEVGAIVLSERGDLAISLKDMQVSGLIDFKIKSLKINAARNLFNFDLDFPAVRAVGSYDINGRLLLLPVKGKGKFNGTFTGVEGNVKMATGVKKIDGINQFEIKNIKIKTTIKRGHLDLGNLFENNKEIGDIINQSINENFDALGAEIMPIIEKAFEREVIRIANRFSAQFNYDQLFPE